MKLRIPGPTPCPEEALRAMSEQVINHRGSEFEALMERLTKMLKEVFYSRNDVLIFTASGTGGMEAAVVNCLSPGDRVLATSIGVFGDRFADIAERYGASVQRLIKPRGTALDPQELRQALEKDPKIKAALITHNETSTGVTNNLGVLAPVVREFDKLLLVDASSSLGAIPVRTDDWELDVVITGIQKGLMSPPGLVAVSVSQRAWEAYRQARMPRYYFDFGFAKKSLEKNHTPWTPAVSVCKALAAALELMLREGLENVFERHRRLARRFREKVTAQGWSLFADESCVSDAVTALRVPPPMDAKRIVGDLKNKYGQAVAGGQEELAGKIIRVGHMGFISESDIDEVAEALGRILDIKK